MPPNRTSTEDTSHEPRGMADTRQFELTSVRREGTAAPCRNRRPGVSYAHRVRHVRTRQRKSEPRRDKMDHCGNGQHGRSESRLTQGEADGETEMADRRLALPPNSFERNLLPRGDHHCPHWCRRTTQHHPLENRDAAVLIGDEAQGRMAIWRRAECRARPGPEGLSAGDPAQVGASPPLREP